MHFAIKLLLMRDSVHGYTILLPLFQLMSIYVSFIKKGNTAHQSLVVQYESFVEDQVLLNITLLTARGFYSKEVFNLLFALIKNWLKIIYCP